MKHMLANRIIIIATLLALTLSAAGAAPVQAAGPFTHDEVVRMAFDLLPTSELKNLLTAYKGNVLVVRLKSNST